MPDIELVAAIWNRDTHTNQFGGNTDRVQALKKAIQACERQFARVLKPLQKVTSLFVAPEYFFAAEMSGKGQSTGSFHLRGVTETAKDFIVAQLIGMSKTFPRTLIVPGTIAWWKSLNRRPEDAFKRDPETNLRTTVPKTGTRMDKVDNALYQNWNSGGSRGGRIPTELLKAKVRAELLRQQRLAPSLPGVNPEYQTVSNDDVLNEVYRILNDDTELVQYGPIQSLVRGVPSQGEAQNLLRSGAVDKVMKNTAFVLLNGKIRFKYNKANDFHEALSEDGSLIFCPGNKSGFTSIEGIDIGLEICLDHCCGQLANTPLPVTGKPHLHIITSASVEPKGAHIVIRDNGYIVHASSRQSWAYVQQWTGANWVRAELLEETQIYGDPLQLFKIKLTVA